MTHNRFNRPQLLSPARRCNLPHARRTLVILGILFLSVVPGIFAMLRLIGWRGAMLAHVATALELVGWIALPGLVLNDL